MQMSSIPLELDFPPGRVKAIRVRLGLGQQEFATKLRVSLNMVSRWEQGRAAPSRARVLKALLDAEEEAYNVVPA